MDKKRLARVNVSLSELESSINQLAISASLKHALVSIIKDVRITLDSDELPIIDTPKSQHMIEMEEFALNCITRELTVDGITKKLPNKEFAILVKLASSPARPVEFERSHATFTRMSNIRRLFPIFKKILVNDNGRYVLYCNPKG